MTADAQSAAQQGTAAARALLTAAACVGLVHAAFSLYWAVGGRWLLPTVGQWAVDAGNEAPLVAGLVLGVVATVKVVVALTPVLALRDTVPLPRRVWRSLAWLAAVVLAAYGALNCVVAWLVLSGVVQPAGGYDRDAMMGHGYLWDPLFLIWGLLLGAGLFASRREGVLFP